MKKIVVLLISSLLLFSCSNNDNSISTGPKMIIKFKFDPNQERLNNLGLPSTILAGNAGQTPDFNKISAHYLELASNAYTQLGDGAVLHHAPETNAGGETAIDFNQAIIVEEGETFLNIPLSNVPSGNYEYVRESLSYQNYGIKVLANGTLYDGTIDSFVGYNTYIATHYIGNVSFPLIRNRLQGYWAFVLNDYPYSTSGQSSGTTTVPNPITATSPIPSGSCVVTGAFANDLTISGNETQDIVVELSLSINNSFEWEEVNFDGKYEPSAGEQVVDMGLRGLIPSYN